MRGVDVYRRDDIPDSYYYKNGRYVQEILVCAKHGKMPSHFQIDTKKLTKFKHFFIQDSLLAELTVRNKSRVILPHQDQWFGAVYMATTTHTLTWEPSSWPWVHLSKSIIRANRLTWWISIKSMLTFWTWSLNRTMALGHAFDLTSPTVPHSPKSSAGIQSLWLCWSC